MDAIAGTSFGPPMAIAIVNTAIISNADNRKIVIANRGLMGFGSSVGINAWQILIHHRFGVTNNVYQAAVAFLQ